MTSNKQPQLADAETLEKWKSDLWNRTKTDEFWHVANVAFSKKDRDAFNTWNADLLIQAERMRDAARGMRKDEMSLQQTSLEAFKLYEMIRTIPSFEK